MPPVHTSKKDMATIAIELPKPRRRSIKSPVAGRATLPDIYFHKHIDNSRLRREIDVERRREYIGLVGLGVLVFSFVLLLAWQHFNCVRHGYQIEQLKGEYAALEVQNHQYRLEQAALADPKRIDTLARTKLGMVTPGPGQLIQLGRPEPAPNALDAPVLARNFSSVGSGELPHEP
jgi:cell division protein FtsL